MKNTPLHKTFKEKLKLTSRQERRLEDVLAQCRTLYNTALEQRIYLYRQRGVNIAEYTQSGELKYLRAAFPEYATINMNVLQNVVARVDRAYRDFFRRVRQGERAGKPRFLGEHRYHSITYNRFGHNTGNHFDGNTLVLSRLGRFAVQWSRPLQGKVKTVTLSREADGWYVCFCCADVPIDPLPATGEDVGIDLGLKAFVTLSDGSWVNNPRFARQSAQSVKKAQRRVSRRLKGSNRRKKAALLLAKKRQHVKRQRRDFHHKTALMLVQRFDTIYHEQLNIVRMLKNNRMAGAIRDASWRQFLSILNHKAAWAGRSVVAVPAYNTSQTCSSCGAHVAKDVSVHWHECPECGVVLHRDENAARNIKRRGQRLRGVPALAGATNRESATWSHESQSLT